MESYIYYVFLLLGIGLLIVKNQLDNKKYIGIIEIILEFLRKSNIDPIHFIKYIEAYKFEDSKNRTKILKDIREIKRKEKNK